MTYDWNVLAEPDNSDPVSVTPSTSYFSPTANAQGPLPSEQVVDPSTYGSTPDATAPDNSSEQDMSIGGSLNDPFGDFNYSTTSKIEVGSNTFSASDFIKSIMGAGSTISKGLDDMFGGKGKDGLNVAGMLGLTLLKGIGDGMLLDKKSEAASREAQLERDFKEKTLKDEREAKRIKVTTPTISIAPQGLLKYPTPNPYRSTPGTYVG